MFQRKEVLVAIIPTPDDLTIARNNKWYRIRQGPVEGRLKSRWPPEVIAFYQPKRFGESHRYMIEYYAHVLGNPELVSRADLFPDEPPGPKQHQRYYKVIIDSLHPLAQPIRSRPRRLDFIPTTWWKLMHAQEINDLFDESRLEDILWKALKTHDIPAERQVWVDDADEKSYRVDFMIDCMARPLVVEVDGDAYHSGSEQVRQDKERRNAMIVNGWDMLNFTTKHVQEELTTYCIQQIERTVAKLGGYKGSNTPPLPPESNQLPLL